MNFLCMMAYSFAMISITGGKTVDDTIAKLTEVSENARERAARGDEGYARITVENVAAATNFDKRSLG